MRRRFVSDIAVTPELLKGMDHQKADIWTLFGPPWDAIAGTAVVERLIIPTERAAHRHEHAITVRVVGTAEQREAEYDDEEDQ